MKDPVAVPERLLQFGYRAAMVNQGVQVGRQAPGAKGGTTCGPADQRNPKYGTSNLVVMRV